MVPRLYDMKLSSRQLFQLIWAGSIVKALRQSYCLQALATRLSLGDFLAFEKPVKRRRDARGLGSSR